MFKVRNWIQVVSAPILMTTLGCTLMDGPNLVASRSTPPQQMMEMAQMFERRGHYKQAKLAYQKVLAAQPSYPNAQQSLDALVARERSKGQLNRAPGGVPSNLPNVMLSQSNPNMGPMQGNQVPTSPVQTVQTVQTAPPMPPAPPMVAPDVGSVRIAAAPNQGSPASTNQPSNFFQQPNALLIASAIPSNGNQAPMQSAAPIFPNAVPTAPAAQIPSTTPIQTRPVASTQPAPRQAIAATQPPTPVQSAAPTAPVRTDPNTIRMPAPIVAPSVAAIQDNRLDALALLTDPVEDSKPALQQSAPTLLLPSVPNTPAANKVGIAKVSSNRPVVQAAPAELEEPGRLPVAANAPSTAPNATGYVEPVIDLSRISNPELHPFFTAFKAEMVQSLRAKREEFQVPLAAIVADHSAESAARSRAVFLLGAIGPDAIEIVSLLRREMHTDPDPYLRVDLCEAILKIQPDSEDTIKALVSCLKESDVNLRWVAAFALRNAGSQQTAFVVDSLKELLQTDDRKLQRMVFLTLAEFGPASAKVIPELELALTSSDASTRQVAKAALECIAPDRSQAAAIRATLLESEPPRLK